MPFDHQFPLRQPDRKEMLVLLYLWGLVTEAFWGTAFVLWRAGKRPQPSG